MIYSLILIKKRLALVCLLVLIVFVSGAFSAMAQEQTGDGRLQLTISPIPIGLSVEPGNTVEAPLRVRNDGNQAETLRIGVMKFDAHDSTGRPRLIDPTPQDDFIHWVTFSEIEFTIEPGQWKTIMATFNVPQGAAFGYYYAITFTRPNVPQPTEEEPTAIHGGPAILVLLEAMVPNAVRSIEVLEFSVDKPWYEFLPVTFNTTLRNAGNVHVAPRGNIFIKRGKGEDEAILEVNPQIGNILPDSSRVYSSAWNDGFPLYELSVENGETVIDEDGNAVTKLKWDFSKANKLRWGKYTANMLLVYDDGQRDIPVEASTSFWIIPWRMLIALMFIGVFLLIGLYSTFRSFFRSVSHRRNRSQFMNTRHHWRAR